MRANEIVAILRNPNVPDLSNSFKGQGSEPVSFGSSGDLHYVQHDKGDVAIRSIRIFLTSNTKNQRILKTASDELGVWGRLKHDNIVPLLGVACFQEQAALVSSWVRYGSIVDYCREHASFNRLKMSAEVASAVAYLHGNGVIHGDIKAQNILVSVDGHAKLAGFGNSVLREIASHYTDGKDFATLSMRWIAPEVLQGTATKNEAVDVYALGLTILEILTGKIPFINDSDQEVIIKILNYIIPSRPRELDSQDELWGLLKQCWSSNPSSRPSAAEIHSRLMGMIG
ncbi:unnamed protein product [Rhizoctonia solani]|uniref:Protein kinase domain-containing protein n=1 Tax=Rhizoctonia solani TaxID=456999 RepID=A0A8H2Y3A0_9AGAM|nr:unnamed protein product [Rhizoctonia solani]